MAAAAGSLALLEVRKSAESTVWYDAFLRDVIGSRALVGFPDAIWPDREVDSTPAMSAGPAVAVQSPLTLQCEQAQHFEAFLKDELASLHARLASEFQRALQDCKVTTAIEQDEAAASTGIQRVAQPEEVGGRPGPLSWLFCPQPREGPSTNCSRPTPASAGGDDVEADDPLTLEQGPQEAQPDDSLRAGEDTIRICGGLDTAPSDSDDSYEVLSEDALESWAWLVSRLLNRSGNTVDSIGSIYDRLSGGCGLFASHGAACSIEEEEEAEHIDEDGDVNWQPHSDWMVGLEMVRKQSSSSRSTFAVGVYKSSGSLGRSDMISCGVKVKDRGFAGSFSISPDGPVRHAWTLMGMVILCYDVLVMPLELSQLIAPRKTWLAVLGCLYWIIDIPVTACTGYHKPTHLEMRLRKSFKKYAKGWLGVHLVLVISDIVFISIQSGSASVRAVRLFRLIRTLRLIRALKVIKLLENMSRMYLHESIRALLTIFKLTFVVALLSHFVACMFYALNRVQEGFEYSWALEFNVDSQSTLLSYMLSYHWAIAQFTPATTDVAPTTQWGRALSIAVCMVALSVFSSFISNVIAAVQEMSLRTFARRQERDSMLTYVQQKRVTVTLMNSIVHFIDKHSHAHRPELIEPEVSAIKVLPESLRLVLHSEVYGRMLETNALFRSLRRTDERFWLQVSHTCMTEKRYLGHQEIFLEGTAAGNMYVPWTGVLSYKQARAPAETVEPELWISEGALWTEWTHVGSLVAVKTSNVIQLDCNEFRQLAVKKPVAYSVLRICAILFCHAMETDEALLPSDLTIDSGQEGSLIKIAHRALRFTKHDVYEDDQIVQDASTLIGLTKSTSLLFRSPVGSVTIGSNLLGVLARSR